MIPHTVGFLNPPHESRPRSGPRSKPTAFTPKKPFSMCSNAMEDNGNPPLPQAGPISEPRRDLALAQAASAVASGENQSAFDYHIDGRGVTTSRSRGNGNDSKHNHNYNSNGNKEVDSGGALLVPTPKATVLWSGDRSTILIIRRDEFFRQWHGTPQPEQPTTWVFSCS